MQRVNLQHIESSWKEDGRYAAPSMQNGLQHFVVSLSKVLVAVQSIISRAYHDTWRKRSVVQAVYYQYVVEHTIKVQDTGLMLRYQLSLRCACNLCLSASWRDRHSLLNPVTLTWQRTLRYVNYVQLV